ncbi:MAG TPA: phosphoglucosamine mutase [Candidatus Subteraquimicrobiales bacterium]
MPKLFGTDGIRGIANDDLSPELAFNLGRVGSLFLAPGGKGKFVVGKDTRISGDLLEAALTAGILSTGSDVLKVDVMPTAAIAYLARHLRADGGVVISASHNPAEYNGIKFFDGAGFKLSSDQEEEVEKLLAGSTPGGLVTGGQVGTILEVKEAAELYIDHLASTISGDLEGFRVAIDCANGAAYKVAPAILERLKAKVSVFCADPDGLNINKDCGSTHPDDLQDFVSSSDVDLGLAYDGDADRVIAIDEKGEVVDGDFIMAICALHYKKKNDLPNDTVVTTVMTNMGFDLALSQAGIKVLKTNVGDRYVLEEMVRKNVALGGEQSGHIIFLGDATTGDGIVTSLKLMAVLKELKRPFSEVKRVMSRLPQVLLNVKVDHKEKLSEVKRVWDEIERAEAKLNGKGRILVRPSGTEEVVRVMVEAREDREARTVAQAISGIIKEELG